MIQQLNHVAIAVADLSQAVSFYRDVLGATVSKPHPLPEHGVTTVFVDLKNTKIELITPLGDHSPIEAFVAKHPGGAIHHLCFEVNSINEARDQLERQDIRTLGNIKVGAHDKPVLFLHPKDCLNCLIELEQS
jgi:methylmalonyl-CoA/ethylmalonyl-CoA epimerase